MASIDAMMPPVPSFAASLARSRISWRRAVSAGVAPAAAVPATASCGCAMTARRRRRAIPRSIVRAYDSNRARTWLLLPLLLWRWVGEGALPGGGRGGGRGGAGVGGPTRERRRRRRGYPRRAPSGRRGSRTLGRLICTRRALGWAPRAPGGGRHHVAEKKSQVWKRLRGPFPEFGD